MNAVDYKDYGYDSPDKRHAHHYLWPAIQSILKAEFASVGDLFDLGCGNGSTANMLRRLGWNVVGVDLSESGISQAKSAYPDCTFEQASVYDELERKFGKFQAVVCLEVVEHLYNPKKFAKNIFELVSDNGVAIISTPYHGYLKNLALALSGKMDSHFTALWDGGHIKFWSRNTLRILLEEAGFSDIQFQRVGRVPVLAKSMIAIARK
jgi:2-polyprenyl-6-hydroxyphenyl methylase/3-demethylubiquinone-9 3-methyltransferase